MKLIKTYEHSDAIPYATENLTVMMKYMQYRTQIMLLREVYGINHFIGHIV